MYVAEFYGKQIDKIMIQKSLIIKVKQVSQITEEAIWYFGQYNDAQEQPFEKYFHNLFLEFDIALPDIVPLAKKTSLVGFAILTCDYELEQGSLPGIYRLLIQDLGYLDEIRNVTEFEMNSFALIISYYYKANEESEIQKLEKAFHNIVREWNWSPYVKQEEVKSLIDRFSLKETSQKTEVQEYDIPTILSDYYARINRKTIANLNSFLRKSYELIGTDKEFEKQTQFFAQIIEEVKNGGKNLKSTKDIITHYTGIKFN